MPDRSPDQKVKVTSLPPPSEQDKKADKKESQPKSSGRPRGRPPELEKKLAGLFSSIGVMVSIVNEFDGQVIVANADALAKSWNKMAQENAAVKRALERMTQAGAGGELLFTTAAVAVPIMQNHGAFPRDLPLPFMQPPPPAEPTPEPAVAHDPSRPQPAMP